MAVQPRNKPVECNPYASPQTETSPVLKIARRTNLILSVPLTVAASALAFCCSCYPIGLVGFGIGYSPYPVRDPVQERIGFTIFLAAWPIGIVAAVLVGWRLMRWLRKPVNKDARIE